MLDSAAAPIFERCLVAIGQGRLAEAELLLRQIDLSAAGPATRTLHARLWALAAKADTRTPAARALPVHSRPQISLVTSVFNRFWQLRDALPFNLQTIRGQADIELVLVDFGGDDTSDIRAFVEHELAFDLLSGQLSYFVATTPWTRFHMAIAKNATHQLSQGDFIFSLDADNFFSPDDLTAVREHLQHHPGSVLHQTTGPAPMRHSLWSKYGVLDPADSYHDEQPEWNGSSGRIGVPRAAFERVHGYNESLVGMGMDDIDFLLRSMKAGVGYRHLRIHRPTSDVFIDNHRGGPQREHDNNQQNWALMDQGMSAGRLAPLPLTPPPLTRFHRHVVNCVRASSGARVTLFASLFRMQDYVERYLNDLHDITATPGVCIWLLDVVGSHPPHVTQRLRDAADGRGIHYIAVHRDPGLYALWNIAISAIGSPYLGNLNADDLRGPHWLPHCLRVLEAGIADVASPVTAPFTDTVSRSHAEALAALHAAGAPMLRWFESRCVVEGSFPNETIRHEPLADGVYAQDDLFQLMHGNRLDSYCMPNASAVWSRRVHELGGLFDEHTWGTFADLALWAEAGARGARFRQVPAVALFHVGAEQAHRRQTRNDTRLVQLALRHGAPGMRAWVSRRQFDLSRTGRSLDSRHPRGWSRVRDEIGRQYLHTAPRLMLDMAVEDAFLGDTLPAGHDPVLRQPWAGFIHGTQVGDPQTHEDAWSIDALLGEHRFVDSLAHCGGLIALSERSRAYVARRLAEQGLTTPVFLLHPPAMSWAPATGLCTVDLGTTLRPMVFHTGSQSESLALFASLQWDPSLKALLCPPGDGADAFVAQRVDPSLRAHGLGSADTAFAQICDASAADREHILRRGIIFSRDASGCSSLVLDCIDAGAALVINRHPAHVEYLGADYPLFYDDAAEADSKLALASTPGFDMVLQAHLEALRAHRPLGRFCRDLGRIGEQIYDSF